MSGGEVFEALGGLLVNYWKVKEEDESGGTRCEEEISRDFELAGYGKS